MKLVSIKIFPITQYPTITIHPQLDWDQSIFFGCVGSWGHAKKANLYHSTHGLLGCLMPVTMNTRREKSLWINMN